MKQRKHLFVLTFSLLALIFSFSPAIADINIELKAGVSVNSTRLRNTYFWYRNGQTWEFDSTDENGRATLDISGYSITLTVCAHSGVVRMLKSFLDFSNDQLCGARTSSHRFNELYVAPNASSNVIFVPGDDFIIAAKLQYIYNRTLREFGPWQNGFQNGAYPNAIHPSEDNWIEAVYPDHTSALSYVEPDGQDTRFPLMHLVPAPPWDPISSSAVTPVSGITESTLAHELAHALHFSKVSLEKRSEIQGRYVQWITDELLHVQAPFHNFHAATSPFVAYIEAFGLFNSLYWQTRFEPPVNRHQEFFNVVQNIDANRDGNFWFRDYDIVSGDDVEGAILKTLFVEFADNPEVGLDYVVTTYVECESVDIYEYGSCIADLEGRDSVIYAHLYQAASESSIFLEPILLPSETGRETGIVDTRESEDSLDFETPDIQLNYEPTTRITHPYIQSDRDDSDLQLCCTEVRPSDIPLR